MVRISKNNKKRIIENCLCFVKRNFVFFQICFCFFRVLLKLHKVVITLSENESLQK
jgi:hypothetical protein